MDLIDAEIEKVLAAFEGRPLNTRRMVRDAFLAGSMFQLMQFANRSSKRKPKAAASTVRAALSAQTAPPSQSERTGPMSEQWAKQFPAIAAETVNALARKVDELEAVQPDDGSAEIWSDAHQMTRQQLIEEVGSLRLAIVERSLREKPLPAPHAEPAPVVEPPPLTELRDAAQAVVDRWARPALWAHEEVTSMFVHRLRAALASAPQKREPLTEVERERWRQLVLDYSVCCGELSNWLEPNDPMWSELKALGARFDSAALSAQAPKAREPYCTCPPKVCYGKDIKECRWQIMGYAPKAKESGDA